MSTAPGNNGDRPPAAKAAALLDRARVAGTVSATEILDAVPSPDEVDPASYEASVAALGELGTGMLSPDHAAPIPATPRRRSDDDSPTDDSLRMYLREIRAYPLLTASEEVALAKRIEAGNHAALHRMVMCNIRLAASVAFRYARAGGVPAVDLIQEGSAGLITAAKKFDWRRGYRFSTYAMYWIQQSIQRAIADQGRTIRIPLHAADRLRRIRRAESDLTQLLGRDPTIDEIASHLTLRPETVAALLRAAPEPLSLQAPRGADDDDGDDRRVADTQANPESPSPEDTLTRAVARAHLEHHLRLLVRQLLPPREQAVIAYVYHLYDGRIRNNDAARRRLRRLGVVSSDPDATRARIRLLERRALKRLGPEFITRSLETDLAEIGLAWHSKWILSHTSYDKKRPVATVTLRITIPGGAPTQTVRIVAVGAEGTTVSESQSVHAAGRRITKTISGPVPLTIYVYVNGSMLHRIEAAGQPNARKRLDASHSKTITSATRRDASAMDDDDVESTVAYPGLALVAPVSGSSNDEIN